MDTVIKPSNKIRNNYNPVISSDSVIESGDNKPISQQEYQYLKVNNYLGEFKTKEAKQKARDNLDIKNTNFSTDVIFSNDLTITTDVGVHKVDNTGNKVLPIKGMNLQEVMQYLYSEIKVPTITQPYIVLNSQDMGSKEVGTNISPRYVSTLNPGLYEYGPDTNVQAISWNIQDTNGYSSAESSGVCRQFQVVDTTNYSISATVQHTEGKIPVNNLGQEYLEGQISQGSKSKTLGTITGHRKSFYGTVTNKQTTIDSNLIRNLQGKSTNALTNGSKFDINIPLNAIRIIIAYPASLRQLTQVLDVNGFNAPIESEFIKNKTIIQVKGANDYNAIDYQVYYMDYANPNDKVNTYKVTI